MLVGRPRPRRVLPPQPLRLVERRLDVPVRQEGQLLAPLGPAARTAASASITLAEYAPAKNAPSPGLFFTKQDPFLVLNTYPVQRALVRQARSQASIVVSKTDAMSPPGRSWSWVTTTRRSGTRS